MGIIKARVFRYDPSSDRPGYLQEFALEYDAPVSAMAMLARIHEIDPTFACRTSKCFHGTCGSCLVRVNGRDVKGCMSMVRPGETVTVEPHSRYKVLRDVVVDFDSPVGAAGEEEVSPDETH